MLYTGQLNVNFTSEFGVDAGALRREWLQDLWDEITKPERGFFSGNSTQNLHY
jgi:hypothetical protein